GRPGVACLKRPTGASHQVRPRRLREERVLHSPAKIWGRRTLPADGALLGRPAGEAVSGDRAQPTLGLAEDLLDAIAQGVGLLLQVPAYQAYLTLEAAAVLLPASLDTPAALAQFALDQRAALAHPALEPVAGAGATALVALELALE